MLSSKRKQQAIALAKEEAHDDFFRVHPWSHIAPYENVRAAGIAFVENTRMSIDDKRAFGTLVAQTYQAEIIRLTHEQQRFEQSAGTVVSQEGRRALTQILQIVAFNDIPLPESLQRLFPGWDHKADLYYSIYTAHFQPSRYEGQDGYI